ncbi:MAG TPA: class I mannose-6-phosphate isomerase, partial [Methylomirabilota bacterium]|nr:class I mannose-6-phosphate isomerase [Methylomirabilota bacterium]
MRSLAPFYPQKRDLAQPVGEAWLTARQCRITTGEFSGRDLQAAWCELPPEARGAGPSAAQDLPLLVKLIFPADKLSIQVHPDDGYASSHEGPGAQGKTEMWHVLAAEHGATLLLGLKPGTTDHAFRAALEAQNLEELFEKRSVQEGDTFFVPAGAPHTIGAGMVLCEIQQYSDLTYRVYDYGRLDASGAPRELHVEKALEVMRYGPSRAGKVKPLARAAGFSLLAASRYFAAERWEFPHPGEIPLSAGHFDLLVIGAGSGHFEWPDGEGAYKSGEAWFVPAGDAAFRVLPDEHTAVIRAYVPDLARLRA